jgi:hypothetical protein
VLARALSTKPFTFLLIDRPVLLSSHDSWSLSVNLCPLTHYLYYTKPLLYCGLQPYYRILELRGFFLYINSSFILLCLVSPTIALVGLISN